MRTATQEMVGGEKRGYPRRVGGGGGEKGTTQEGLGGGRRGLPKKGWGGSGNEATQEVVRGVWE